MAWAKCAVPTPKHIVYRNLYTALYFLAEIKSIHERKIYPKKTDTSNSQVISGYHFSLQKYRMNNLKPVRPIFPTISPLKAWLAKVTSRSSLVPVISGGMQQVTGKTQVDNDVCRMLVRGLLVPSEKKKSTCEETIISWSFLLSQSSGSICQAFTDFHPIRLKNTRIRIP